MNVKQGDLAYIYFPGHADHNRFVTVLEPVGTVRKGDVLIWGGVSWESEANGFAWGIKACNGVFSFGLNTCLCNDARLRPIRDPGPGAVDETLTRNLDAVV